MSVIPRASVKYKRYYMHTTEQQVILLVMFEVITFFHSKILQCDSNVTEIALWQLNELLR